MLVRLVWEHFFPAQYMDKMMYLGRGSNSLGKTVRPRSSLLSKINPSKVVPIAALYSVDIWGTSVRPWFMSTGVFYLWWHLQSKGGVQRKEPDSSTTFSEAAIRKGFSWHFACTQPSNASKRGMLRTEDSKSRTILLKPLLNLGWGQGRS